MTIQDNENIINFDNSLKNAFGKYGVVIILLITSIINLGIYVSDIINEFKIRLSLTYINGILNSIITDLLIFELLIIFCITILVFKRNKSSLLTPLIGYGLNQLAIILYNVNNLINVFIVVKETHFQVNQLLSFILINLILLFTSLFYAVFLIQLARYYYKPINIKNIIISSFLVPICLIINGLISIIRIKDYRILYIAKLINSSYNYNQSLYVSLGIAVSILILIFWLIFPFRLISELKKLPID